MANIQADITELRAMLDRTPASHNVMLVGSHGIGKSEFLTEYFTSIGIPVVTLFLGQMADPGDLIGLPHKDDCTGRTEFMPPYWFPVDGRPVVLFLDELNRARPEILQTVMDLCLNRKLAERSLPQGSRIIAAVNYGDNYQITDLDPALVSRFNILTFRPTVEEWLLWARKVGVDSRVTDFIQENHMWLDRNVDGMENEDTGIEKTPDRRAWKRVSDIISGRDILDTLDAKLISSIVGPKAASAFLSSTGARCLVSGKEVLYTLGNVMKKLRLYKLHELSIVNDSIFRHLETEDVAETDKGIIKDNVVKYFDYLAKKKKEAAAHFASLYVSQTYPEAVKYLACECPSLTAGLLTYLESIQ